MSKNIPSHDLLEPFVTLETHPCLLKHFKPFHFFKPAPSFKITDGLELTQLFFIIIIFVNARKKSVVINFFVLCCSSVGWAIICVHSMMFTKPEIVFQYKTTTNSHDRVITYGNEREIFRVLWSYFADYLITKHNFHSFLMKSGTDTVFFWVFD